MAETLNPPVHERCRFLFSKGMFVEVERDPSIPQSGTDSGLYWCSHTQTCLGPDGQLADDRNCKPGRACYDGL